MKKYWFLAPMLAIAIMAGAWVLLGGGDKAFAQCGNSCAPPPSCQNACPPPPTPPPTPPCCTPGHNVVVPGVKVYVSPTVVVNANVNANVNTTVNAGSSANGGASAGGIVVVGGGGNAFGYAGPGPVNILQGLNVVTAPQARRVAFEASRSKTTRIVIRAYCLDDKNVPHPASQVIPDKDIDDLFEGELYRCIAGTRLQYAYAEYTGQDDFTGGKTVICAKGEALYRGRGANGGTGQVNAGGGGGTLSCRAQEAARECNERSLLRRYGAGVKILAFTIVETYTDYREEYAREESAFSTMNFTLDGGVGGFTY